MRFYNRTTSGIAFYHIQSMICFSCFKLERMS